MKRVYRNHGEWFRDIYARDAVHDTEEAWKASRESLKAEVIAEPEHQWQQPITPFVAQASTEVARTDAFYNLREAIKRL